MRGIWDGIRGMDRVGGFRGLASLLLLHCWIDLYILLLYRLPLLLLPYSVGKYLIFALLPGRLGRPSPRGLVGTHVAVVPAPTLSTDFRLRLILPL